MKKTRKKEVKEKNGNRVFFPAVVFSLILSLLAVFLSAMFFLYGLSYSSDAYLLKMTENNNANMMLLIGSRDKHGCLMPAGYSWCEIKQKCLRSWEESCLSASSTPEEKQAAVKKYLEKNISLLSPEKEILGGKFSITEINFLSDKTAFIGYEDGHVSFNAEVIFNIADSQVEIEKFAITNKNGEPRNLFACQKNSDCIPLASECHPKACVNKKYFSDFIKPQACTLQFDVQAAYSAEDCFCAENDECANRNLNKAKSTEI